MKPPAEELERRRPVWEAISSIFLDTEIDDAWREQIVETLRSSGYSESELESILWTELCPVLHANLLSVAGEWAGFDMEWVEHRIVSCPAGRIRQWMAYFTGGNIARHAWRQIKESLAARLAR
jgi:hypothetical protein